MRITEPTLLLDKERCLRNIGAMSQKAKKHGLLFRPHFKTHQSRIIGRWFRDFGISAITVSSLKMAGYFADDGWNDITVAFPVNVLEIERINYLAEKIHLNLLVESAKTASLLDHNLLHQVGVYMKIDAGYHRTGIPAERSEEIEGLVNAIDSAAHLRFLGFIAHAGHTYRAGSPGEIVAIHDSTRAVMAELKERFVDDHPEILTSIGDTPGCSLAEEFTGIDEIRPGNFVFYDAMQVALGSCEASRVAVAMACPVVAQHADRNEMIIYGGAVHFSQDSISLNGSRSFGTVVPLEGTSWGSPIGGGFISSLSQEHGVVSATTEVMRSHPAGSLIGILPIHSCLTADCMKGYYSPSEGFIDHMSRKL